MVSLERGLAVSPATRLVELVGAREGTGSAEHAGGRSPHQALEGVGSQGLGGRTWTEPRADIRAKQPPTARAT